MIYVCRKQAHMIGYLRNWFPEINWMYFAIVFLFFTGMFIPPHHNNNTYDKNLIERRTDALIPSLSDSVSHNAYKKIRDSITNIVYKENLDNMTLINSWGVSNFSVSESYTSPNKFYFVLPGYEFSSFRDFYTLNGKNYVEEIERNGKTFEYKTTETKVKLIPDQENKQINVLLPISKQTKILVQFILVLVAFLVLIFGLYSMLKMPGKLILNISKGIVFTEENIKALYVIATFLFACVGISVFAKILLHFIFYNQIPDAVSFSYYNTIMDQRFILIAALVALLFARAFRRGYELENEVDLTV
jgi:hypothetical protein